MRKIDERQIIQKAAAGNSFAFEQLVQKYQSQVYRLCFRMTGNPEDAADLTQEAFLKAWNHLASFQFEAAFSTWLYRLTSNACLDFLRSAKRRTHVSMTMENEEGEEQALEVMDPQPLPEETAIQREQQALVRHAIGQLEPEQRQILTLRVVNDLSYTEIAKIMCLKEGTVKSRLSRAREALRKKLEQIGNKSINPASNQMNGGGGNGL